MALIIPSCSRLISRCVAPIAAAYSKQHKSFAETECPRKPIARKLHHQATAKFHQLASEQDRISIPIVHGDLSRLQPKVRDFIERSASVCQPSAIHICDGSEQENGHILQTLQNAGQVKKLPKHDNCWLTLTDPRDVARVESKTVICTNDKRTTVPTTRSGVQGTLGKWISPEDLDAALWEDRFPGCMTGRTMYVIPFSMGPVGSKLSKVGVEITDSPYVVASMRVMTRIGDKVMPIVEAEASAAGHQGFVRAVHSVGQPLPLKKDNLVNNWPCNPEKTLISHIPDENMIVSFGSGYGGNSLLGKKCFALRLGSILAKKEGWLAEHMLILGITNPAGEKKYIAAAFPSACGKTNLAMMVPSLPGWKVECVGDDIAWMRFDEEGKLRAINPEAGFFGVAPGTSMATNPSAMQTIQSNTLFTNVAETSDGGFWWEGMAPPEEGVKIHSWTGDSNWTKASGKPAAHPNSRFCTPAAQCPMMDPNWEDPKGVPIDAVVFGGRRPKGVPLVYESFDWDHGVFIGAAMKSEATAAAEHKGKEIMHDPFAMRPFFGYNFGHYLDHWLSMKNAKNAQLPKVFHVNWFRKGDDGTFLWPGFGENSRVLDWICQRVDGKDVATESSIGLIPKTGSINLEGLEESVDWDALFSIPKDFWVEEAEEIGRYFQDQLPEDLPDAVGEQLLKLKNRVQNQ